MQGTDTPTDGQAAPAAPAEGETSTPVAEQQQENETQQAPEPAESDGEGEVDKPKRRSGYDRLKRKNQYLQSQILTLQEQMSQSPKEETASPKEEDFNGDWGKFIAATAAHEATKGVKNVLSEKEKTERTARVAELQQQLVEDFEERTETFRAKATDFDQVVEKFVGAGNKLTDTVRDLVIESDQGPELVYYLAKNPAIANQLNGMPALAAAKKLGAIELELSRPQARTTKAPPPLKTPNGGASPPSDLTALAKSDDIRDFVKLRETQRKARA